MPGIFGKYNFILLSKYPINHALPVGRQGSGKPMEEK